MYIITIRATGKTLTCWPFQDAIAAMRYLRRKHPVMSVARAAMLYSIHKAKY